jgi:GNAT superfamily N-acetyltransferase
MALATWWVSNELPQLPELTSFDVRRIAEDDLLLAQVNHIDLVEVQVRRSYGHQPYIAYINDDPVAYGWVATREASIGELKLEFPIPPRERYLWDFATLPDWQGYGIYPHLLQAILQAERNAADRFWIIYAPENLPSGVGMHKAGFASVGQLSFRHDGAVVLVSLDNVARAKAGAELLNIPLANDEVSPCWRCVEKLVCSCQYNPAQCSCAIEVKSGKRA